MRKNDTLKRQRPKYAWGKEPPKRNVGAPGVPVVAPPNYFEYELPREEAKS